MEERGDDDDAAASPTDRVASEAATLQRVISELSGLRGDARQRIVEMLCIFFRLDMPAGGGGRAAPVSHPQPPIGGRIFQFSEPETRSPAPPAKRFLVDKAPTSDVERVACLAYYLTHFRGTPHFKTSDISALNVEAAARQFSNAAFAVNNATNSGYLVPSVKGAKQLSAAGERFVEALPDRLAAREAMAQNRPKRSHGKRSRTGTGNE
jgi:hypothetical protein